MITWNYSNREVDCRWWMQYKRCNRRRRRRSVEECRSKLDACDWSGFKPRPGALLKKIDTNDGRHVGVVHVVDVVDAFLIKVS